MQYAPQPVYIEYKRVEVIMTIVWDKLHKEVKVNC